MWKPRQVRLHPLPPSHPQARETASPSRRGANLSSQPRHLRQGDSDESPRGEEQE